MVNDYTIINGELYHYGRKGMKWGQHIFGKDPKSNLPSYVKDYGNTQLGYGGTARLRWDNKTINKALEKNVKNSANNIDTKSSAYTKGADKAKNAGSTKVKDVKDKTKEAETNKTNVEAPKNNTPKQVNKLKTSTDLATQTKNTFDGATKISDVIIANKKYKRDRTELDALDNQQLRQRVERLELEQRYKNATREERSKGERAVTTALTVGSSLAGLAATGLTIATLIQQLRGKK